MQNIHVGGLSTNRSRQNTNQLLVDLDWRIGVLNYLGLR